MLHNIYSVYDIKAGGFITPFYLQNHEMALRIFKECANSKQHMFGRFPLDYSLHYIGTFDDVTGTLVSHPIIEVLAKAVDVIERDIRQQDIFELTPVNKMEAVK